MPFEVNEDISSEDSNLWSFQTKVNTKIKQNTQLTQQTEKERSKKQIFDKNTLTGQRRT